MTDVDITTQFVDKFYEMNPATEYVLFDGNELREGMVVLIEAPGCRENSQTVHSRDKSWMENLKLLNRWCTVTKPMINKEIGSVSFLAVYEGNIVRKRIHNLDAAWIVKIDSLPSDHPAWNR